MDIYGYGGFGSPTGLPARADEFLKRPLRLSKALDYQLPHMVEPPYLGFNLVAFNGHFYAIDKKLGPFDILQASGSELSALPNADNLNRLKAMVNAQTAPPQNETVLVENLVPNSYVGSFFRLTNFLSAAI